MEHRLSKAKAKEQAKQIKKCFSKTNQYIDSRDYELCITKNGNLAQKHIPTNTSDIYEIYENFHNVYVFKQITQGILSQTGIDLNTELQETSETLLNAIKGVFAIWRPYVSSEPKITRLGLNKNICYAEIRLGVEWFDIETSLKEYKSVSEDSRERQTWFIEQCIQKVEHSMNNVPNDVMNKLRNKVFLDKDVDSVYGAKAKTIHKFISAYPANLRALVAGKSQSAKITSIHNKIYSNDITASFDPANKCFVIRYGPYVYQVDSYTYQTISGKKDIDLIRSIKKDMQKICEALSYYQYVLSCITKINDFDCKILTGAATSTVNVPEQYKLDGVCYNDVLLPIAYQEKIITAKVSIPHLQKAENDVAQLKKDAKPILSAILADIKFQIKSIDNQIKEQCRSDNLLYQSFAAKTIYDFLSSETHPHSMSRICDYLNQGKENEYINRDNDKKYKGILQHYKKDYLKSIILHMRVAGLLEAVTVKGTYGKFDTFRINPNNSYYRFYFDDYVRKETEIMKDLKEGNVVSAKDAEAILKKLTENKIANKNTVYVLNILKNHEFVINHHSEIEVAFACLPESTKLYIPFIIDEFKKGSIEQKLLKK